MTTYPTGRRVLLCGTRAVIETPTGRWRVVCASCGAGGTVEHPTRQSAGHACIRDSNRACTACGAA